MMRKTCLKEIDIDIYILSISQPRFLLVPCLYEINAKDMALPSVLQEFPFYDIAVFLYLLDFRCLQGLNAASLADI
jgi:hypothetical protein